MLLALFIVAIAASAVSGTLAAGRHSMDLIGVLIVANVTALGGGTTRDVLLDHYPLFWVANPWALGVTSGAALLTIVAARFIDRLKNLYLASDAIGLVVVTIVGCDIALEAGHHPAIAVLAGMITGCVGGVLRDVLCNQVPLLFSGELYASVSVLTGAIYVSGLILGFDANMIAIVAVVIGLTLRLLAIRFRWGMPKFVYTSDWV